METSRRHRIESIIEDKDVVAPVCMTESHVHMRHARMHVLCVCAPTAHLGKVLDKYRFSSILSRSQRLATHLDLYHIASYKESTSFRFRALFKKASKFLCSLLSSLSLSPLLLHSNNYHSISSRYHSHSTRGINSISIQSNHNYVHIHIHFLIHFYIASWMIYAIIAPR